MNADVYIADEEGHSIDSWASTQSVLVTGLVLPVS
jgi:hypothetical protein